MKAQLYWFLVLGIMLTACSPKMQPSKDVPKLNFEAAVVRPTQQNKVLNVVAIDKNRDLLNIADIDLTVIPYDKEVYEGFTVTYNKDFGETVYESKPSMYKSLKIERVGNQVQLWVKAELLNVYKKLYVEQRYLFEVPPEQ